MTKRDQGMVLESAAMLTDGRVAFLADAFDSAPFQYVLLTDAERYGPEYGVERLQFKAANSGPGSFLARMFGIIDRHETPVILTFATAGAHSVWVGVETEDLVARGVTIDGQVSDPTAIRGAINTDGGAYFGSLRTSAQKDGAFVVSNWEESFLSSGWKPAAITNLTPDGKIRWTKTLPNSFVRAGAGGRSRLRLSPYCRVSPLRGMLETVAAGWGA